MDNLVKTCFHFVSPNGLKKIVLKKIQTENERRDVE